jgi:Tfp pilus assembly ATPase PilU
MNFPHPLPISKTLPIFAPINDKIMATATLSGVNKADSRLYDRLLNGDFALEDVLVAAKKRKNIRDLRGKISFNDEYDYKAMRL